MDTLRVLRRLAGVGQNRYVGAAVVGSLAGLILLLLFLLIRGQRDTVVFQLQPLEDSSFVRIYVGGAVAEPGLVTLPRGSRTADAIDAAGGLLTNADASSLGMAARLQDADQIIVPVRAPTPALPVQGAAPQGNPPTVPPATEIPAQSGQPVAQDIPVSPPIPSQARDLPININTASAQELERLSGVGPAIAGRIVEYRTINGPFQTLEELAEVSGISSRMVEEMWSLLTLGQ